MKQLLIVFLSFGSIGLVGQNFVEVSYNAGYSTHSFFNISNDSEEIFANEEWDIAFTAIGGADAGIHINEAVSFMGTELELYAAPSGNFEDVIDPVDLSIRLYNDELSWENGAFNSLRDPANPLDYGWGIYNPVSHSVNGNEVFAIKLRNGSFKKFMISSLSDNTYNLQWADLDNANMQTASINKGDYQSAQLILFSLENNEVVAGIQPFDLLFTRYVTPLPDGQGDTLDYVVTGVHSGVGIEIAEAVGVDVENVKFKNYQAELSTQLDVIGQDWKRFDLNTFSWEIADSLAFFLVDQQKTVWKLVFIDFEGSASGNIVFTKENVGMLSSVATLDEVSSMGVYPNPNQGLMDVIIDLDQPFDGELQVMDINGRIAYSRSVSLSSGIVSLNVDVRQLTSGHYRIILTGDKGMAQIPVIIQP